MRAGLFRATPVEPAVDGGRNPTGCGIQNASCEAYRQAQSSFHIHVDLLWLHKKRAVRLNSDNARVKRFDISNGLRFNYTYAYYS